MSIQTPVQIDGEPGVVLGVPVWPLEMQQVHPAARTVEAIPCRSGLQHRRGQITRGGRIQRTPVADRNPGRRTVNALAHAAPPPVGAARFSALASASDLRSSRENAQPWKAAEIRNPYWLVTAP